MIDCFYKGPICDESQDSKEHVILETFGGKIYIKGALCKNCNNHLGNTIDSEAYDLIGVISDLIIEDKQKQVRIPLHAKDGEVMYVSSRMQPYNRFTFFIKKKKIILHLPPNKDMDDFAEKKRKEMGLLKNQTKLTIGEELRNEKLWHIKNKYSGDHPSLGVGGVDYFCHILKTSINFSIYCKIDRDLIQSAIKMLRLKNPSNTHIYCPLHYDPYKPSKAEISHVLHIEGDPTSGFLYCYVELFNFESYLIILSDNYKEEYCTYNYVYDITCMKEIEDPDICIKLSKYHLQDIRTISTSSRKSYLQQKDLKYRNVMKKIENLQKII